jgi:Flp pilus assembly protein protease CpaA
MVQIMLELIISSVAVIALIIASITDLKKREVPDWLNFSLIPLALGIRLIWSLITNDYSFIISGLIGFAVFFIIALIMFYTGQWGGGDSKMLMGLGALLGLEFNIHSELISFLINTVIVGSIYGIFWSLILVIKNRKKFLLELKKITRSIILIRKIMLILFIILILTLIILPGALNKLLIVSLIVIIYTSFYLLIFIKAVERSCMLRYVSPAEVTEGDWIAKDIYIGKQYISGPKDLGIEKKQINQLINYYKKGKIKKVLIKVGIPFVPGFFIAYLITMLFGNLLLFFI